jgi:hypothetical protein
VIKKYFFNIPFGLFDEFFAGFNKEFVPSFGVIDFILSDIESKKVETIRNVYNFGFFG